jgi:hypothetical protein
MGEDRTKSGQHPAVVAYRKKLDSLTEHQIADFDKVNDELGKAAERCRSSCPPAEHAAEEVVP